MLRSANSNIYSGCIHPEVIDQYIAAEVAEGRMYGPFLPGGVADLHINRMGVIPRGHALGRWHLITDLSFPVGSSMNEGIDPGLCSLHYTSVDRVAAEAQQWVRGTLLARLDI